MATTTATTEAPGGESKFPPLDTSTFPTQLFWLVIFFATLYLLMSRLVLPRLAAIIGTRKARIDGDIARARSLKDETEAAVQAYEKALADARANANAIAAETREKVSKEIEAEQATLDAALGAKIKDAESKIAKLKATAMAQVETIAADATADIVAALTGAKATKADVAKALSSVKR